MSTTSRQSAAGRFSLLIALALVLVVAAGCNNSHSADNKASADKTAATAKGTTMDKKADNMADDNSGKIVKTDEEWRQELTPEQYHICREGGTEQAFTGKYYKNKEKGVYICVACGQELFDSDTKYESGSGWPSFYQPADEANIDELRDASLGMVRTEVRCSRCGAHLGHVFEDGPQPTGLRYCINSAALDFVDNDSARMAVDKEEKSEN